MDRGLTKPSRLQSPGSGPIAIRSVELAPGVVVCHGDSLPVIAGPCVIESEELAIETARRLAEMAGRLGIALVFKSSFDKANRSSIGSFRGPGLVEGLRILARVKAETGLPLLTDVHEPDQCEQAAAICDVLQIPAFLCRQTDLVVAAARTGRAVNIKKGQFMAPEDMLRIVEKAHAAANDRVTVTERGASFGYHNLVVDMRSFAMLHDDGIPVLYDVTHSLQLPGGSEESGGARRFAEPLARAAIAAGAAGVFLEVHPDPAYARSDSAVQLDPVRAERLLRSLIALRRTLAEATSDGCAEAPAKAGHAVPLPSRRAPVGRPPRDVAREVLATEAAAVRGLAAQLDERFERAVEMLRSCTGRVVCTGMGKSGLVMKKIAATLSSTGTPALFLHPAEAVHGDLGMVTPGDVVLAASYSGTTEELLRLVETLKRLGVPLVVMTANPASPLARHADIHLSVAIDREACPLGLAPTASTTSTLALGDALAMALLEARGFTHEDFALLHPAGRLGKRLLKVDQLMHAGDRLPSVTVDAPLRDAIYEMSKKGFGITGVVNGEDCLVGCISDGDLRRLLQAKDGAILSRTAGECMIRTPYTIAGDELAAAALKAMEERRITSLFVCDEGGRLKGIVHLHDLWRLELF